MRLEEVAENIWTYEGSKVSFHGFPFSTRTTVVRLTDDDLWIHSPGSLDSRLRQELSALGKVKYLISPNKLHHLFLQNWIESYPDATRYSSPGLGEKRRDIEFDHELSDRAEDEWRGEIDQTIFRGSPALEEVVFHHKSSKTLIVADLIENLDPSMLNWWQRILANAAGILSPDGKMPLDWRVTYVFGDKQKARNSLDTMLNWDIDRIILSHGECVIENGREFLERSFRWLTKTA